MRGPSQSVLMLSAVVGWYFRAYCIGKSSEKVFPKLARASRRSCWIARSGAWRSSTKSLMTFTITSSGNPCMCGCTGMLRPVATPIIVQVDLHGLVHLVHTVGKQVLDTAVLCKGDVRAMIEDETAVLERRRVTAMIGVLVIHHRRNTLSVKPVRRSESPHPASQDDNVWHKSSPFLNSLP